MTPCPPQTVNSALAPVYYRQTQRVYRLFDSLELDKKKASCRRREKKQTNRGSVCECVCAWKGWQQKRERLISQSTCFDQRDIVKIECLSGTMATAETFKWIICPRFSFFFIFTFLLFLLASLYISFQSFCRWICVRSCVCRLPRVSICLVSVRACVQGALLSSPEDGRENSIAPRL